MRSKLYIAFAIDEDYIQHFTVALISILENNVGIPIEIFVLHDLINQEKLLESSAFFLNVYDLKLNLLQIDSSYFDLYPVSRLYPKAIYYRLLIAEIIPSYVDKLLYLDSDIVVTASLSDILKLSFKLKNIFAAEDAVNSNIARMSSLGIELKSYFNSGVLVINLDAWRKNQIGKELMLTLEHYKESIVLPDQDILNIYFRGDWGNLPQTFNPSNLDDFENPKRIPVIIHYMGGSKPWHYLNTHRYKYLYWQYLKLSPYSEFKSKGYKYQIYFREEIFWLKQKTFQVISRVNRSVNRRKP